MAHAKTEGKMRRKAVYFRILKRDKHARLIKKVTQFYIKSSMNLNGFHDEKGKSNGKWPFAIFKTVEDRSEKIPRTRAIQKTCFPIF